MVDLIVIYVSTVDNWDICKRTVYWVHTAHTVTPEDTHQQTVLTKEGNNRMKHIKVRTGDLKKDAKTGKGHKTSHTI